MILNLNRVMVILMFGIVLVDMATGALLLSNPEQTLTPGIIYKIALLGILFYFIPKLNPQVFYANIFIYLTALLASLTTGFYTIVSNFVSASKLVMFVTFFYYLIHLAKKDIAKEKTLYGIALFTYIVIVINQLLGLFGFGKPTYLLYGNPVGTSGFFFEHNAVGIILLIISAIIYMHNRKSISNFKLLLYIVLTIFIGFSFATKTAIAGSLLVSLIAFYDKMKHYLPVFVALLGLLIITNWDIIQQTGQVSKLIDDMENNSGDSNALLSGRGSRFSKSVDDYFVQFNPLEKVFGIGYYRVLNDNKVGGTSEIDFMDILKIAGIVGFAIVYIPIFWISYVCYINYKKTQMREFPIVIILNAIFLVISSTAGHLFMSGSVTFYLALLNAYPFYLKSSMVSRIEDNNLLYSI